MTLVSFASMFYTSNLGELHTGVVNCTASTIPDNELARIGMKLHLQGPDWSQGATSVHKKIVWERLVKCLRLDTSCGQALPNAKYRMVRKPRGKRMQENGSPM